MMIEQVPYQRMIKLVLQNLMYYQCKNFFSNYATNTINNNFTSGSAKDTITVPCTCADQSIYSVSERSTHIPATDNSYHSDLNYLDHPSHQ